MTNYERGEVDQLVVVQSCVNKRDTYLSTNKLLLQWPRIEIEYHYYQAYQSLWYHNLKPVDPLDL